MKFKPEDGIAQVDSVLSSIGHLAHLNNVSQAERVAFVTTGVAAIYRLTPSGSPHRRVVDDALGEPYHGSSVYEVHGALQALRRDIEAGYSISVEELAHADVFGDFIAMAQELLDKGFKDAAAVVAGSVLEGHLRQLAAKHGVSPDDTAGKPKKADRLNADLMNASAYGGLEQKQVTAWLGLRNHAAHGEYEEYDKAQAGLMLQGVTEFLVRNPA